jgi:hypothetical protein
MAYNLVQIPIADLKPSTALGVAIPLVRLMYLHLYTLH